MKIPTKKTSLKIFLITLASILLIGILSYGYVSYRNNLWPFSAKDQTTKDEENIDLLPPTEEQVTDGYTNKDPQVTPSDDKNPSIPTNNGTSQSGKQIVTVTITNYPKNASTMNVGAIVATQTAGKCTATLSRSGVIAATVTGSTLSQTSYLSCIDLSLPINGLSGSYTLTVSFANDTQEGSMVQDVSL